MKKLTKEEIKKYLSKPNHCPKCGSDNIEANGNIDFKDDGQGWVEVTCNKCKFHWRDIYTLNDIGEIQ